MPRRPAALAAACALLLGVAAAARAQQRPALTQQAQDRAWAARLDSLLDAAPFDRALWGVAIADPRGRIVYERNGGRLFVPASATKLIVSAVSAALLGPDYRWRTSVYAGGLLGADGVLRGDLVLYGRGDPTLSARFARSRTAGLEDLADTLAALGLRRVAGDLVGDASWFDSVPVHPDWESGDLAWAFASPVTGLAFNENAVAFRMTPGPIGGSPTIALDPDWGALQVSSRARTVSADSSRRIALRRVEGTRAVLVDGDLPEDWRGRPESLAVADGAQFAADAFRRALAARGITVAGRTVAVYDSNAYAALRAGAPLAERWSVPLRRVLEPVLESSNNWLAEMLVKTLARERTGRGTWDEGLALEERFLAESLGVDSTMLYVSDGSGLSHHDLVAPRGFVQLLRGMRAHPHFEAFGDALPVAGRTGTLRTRFRGTELAGRVRAKTGSIGNVNTLAGYVEAGPNSWWTFAILLNNHAARSREAIDRIDTLLRAALDGR